MNNLVRSDTMKKFFETGDFVAFANALSVGILIVDEEGRVTFMSDSVQRVGFTQITPFIPGTPYSELISPPNENLLSLIETSLKLRQDMQRQISYSTHTYLVESKAIFNDTFFLGCIISFNDISRIAMKEKQQELLYQISSALARVNNMEQILKITVSQVLKSVPATSANIMLFDRTTQTLQIKADSNATDPKYQARSFKLGEGVAGKAALELKPYSIYDVQASPLFTRKNKSDKGALLVIPLQSKGKLFGVLNVRHEQPRYFTENDLQFLTTLVNEVAIALENSDLYERLNRKINQLSELYFVSSFTPARNVDTRIQKIVKLVPNLLEAEDCCIYLHSPSANKLVLKYQKNVGKALPLELDLKKPGLSHSVFTKQETIVLNTISTSPDPTVFKKYKIHNIICAPLCVNNETIGVIHVFNKWTEDFNEEDRNLLNIIAYRISIKIENVQLLRKVQSEKELLDRIIENTSEGVAVLNRRRKIIVWNQYLEDLTGLNSQEVVGQACYKILYNRLGLKQLTQQLYTETQDPKTRSVVPHMHEQQLKTVAGDRIWVGALVSYILDANKNIENTIIVFRNISKDKEFLDAKNDFISVTTHELRTPLTAVKGYLSMVLKGDVGSITPIQHDYFTKAFLATERLVQLVEELLHVFRIDENQLRLSPTAFPITTLIQETIEALTPKAKVKSITLTYSTGIPILVQADLERTKQIIENLLDNAIKYTKERGTIKITLEKRDHEILINVQDTGVGIPSKYLESIFDRFVRIPNSQSVKAGGAGLGLYIVKNLVEKQGGKIWVTSTLGKGSTFHFTLPLAHHPMVSKQTKEMSLTSN